MSKEWDPDTVFDILGCEIAREILALASLRPLSASQLADRCGVSEPTIYRRINALEEHDMLAEQTEIADDGHHYKQFRTTLQEARFHVEDGTYDIDIRINRDYSDRFVDLWSDLEQGNDRRADESPPRRGDAPPDVGKGGGE